MSDTTVPAQPEEPIKNPFLSNAVYDRLKWIALVGLPALGALYFALAPLWDLPKPNEVVGTIIAIDTFLGLVLGLATKNYNASDARYDGVLNVLAEDNRLIKQLDIHTPPEDIASKDAITLKVTQVPSE